MITIIRMDDIENKNFEEILIASDDRDGLGMEVWQNDRLLVEIFRDDQLRTRTITFYLKKFRLTKWKNTSKYLKKKIFGILPTLCRIKVKNISRLIF
ncbi:hypothetical protein [Flavimarina sp. Hel_I_48]|uniref:hypothetical protein n=1 Tax=Flavimarina sp. Hel_I_48 TaxID=1392488 RepID=UPI0004DF876F|nr:hypothetical protein [Flavimarina sp. Hel_I_48]